MVQRREAITARRELYLISITARPRYIKVTRNDRKAGVACLPPFELVRMLTDERSLSVQRTSIMNALFWGMHDGGNMPHVHRGRCHISFVQERGTTPLQRYSATPVLSGGIVTICGVLFLPAIMLWRCVITGNKKLPSNVMLRYKARRRSLIICMRILLAQQSSVTTANVTATLDYHRVADIINPAGRITHRMPCDRAGVDGTIYQPSPLQRIYRCSSKEQQRYWKSMGPFKHQRIRFLPRVFAVNRKAISKNAMWCSPYGDL